MKATQFPKRGKTFSIRAKKRLLDLDMSVEALSRKLRRPRTTVSTAINTDRFPLVRNKVAEALGI